VVLELATALLESARALVGEPPEDLARGADRDAERLGGAGRRRVTEAREHPQHFVVRRRRGAGIGDHDRPIPEEAHPAVRALEPPVGLGALSHAVVEHVAHAGVDAGHELESVHALEERVLFHSRFAREREHRHRRLGARLPPGGLLELGRTGLAARERNAEREHSSRAKAWTGDDGRRFARTSTGDSVQTVGGGVDRAAEPTDRGVICRHARAHVEHRVEERDVSSERCGTAGELGGGSRGPAIRGRIAPRGGSEELAQRLNRERARDRGLLDRGLHAGSLREQQLPHEPRSPRSGSVSMERVEDARGEMRRTVQAANPREHEVHEVLLLREAFGPRHSRSAASEPRRLLAIAEHRGGHRTERRGFEHERGVAELGASAARSVGGVEHTVAAAPEELTPPARDREPTVVVRRQPFVHGHELAERAPVEGEHHETLGVSARERGRLSCDGGCRLERDEIARGRSAGKPRIDERPLTVEGRAPGPRVIRSVALERCDRGVERSEVAGEPGSTSLARGLERRSHEARMVHSGPLTGRASRTSSSYLRVRELGHGGMGTIHLALRIDGTFRRLYAVKRMHAHLRTDPDLRAMFLDEARLAGLISHSNVVGVHDFGEDDEGPFLVMDYVEGIDLSDVLDAMTERGARLPIQVALRIAIAIAQGLHAAHELRDHDGAPLNLVHRDLSPQNVLLSYDGVVRIADFGIAKAAGRSTRTSTGVLKGKLAFMSPEQLRFEEPDRRSDLFALGVLLFEMLAGRRLYGAKDRSDAPRRILTEPPPDLGEERPETPDALVALLFDLLAKSAADRPKNAAVVAQRLEAILVELLGDDDPIDLAAFLGDVFADKRDEERATIAAAVAAVDASDGAGTVELPIDVSLETTDVDRATAPAQKTRSSTIRIAAALVAVALVGGGSSFAVWELLSSSRDPGDAAASPEPRPIGPARPMIARETMISNPPDEPLEGIATRSEQPSPTIAAAEPALESDPQTGVTSAEGTTGEHRERRPASRRRARRTAAMADSPAPPPVESAIMRWGWDQSADRDARRAPERNASEKPGRAEIGIRESRR
jgi:eukaryotic-like serine/threonine-protein kinase